MNHSPWPIFLLLRLLKIILISLIYTHFVNFEYFPTVILPPFRRPCLVLSCFFRVHPLGGLFLAHAEAGLHCTVQSITPPWAGYSGLVHLNQSWGVVRLLHMYCPSSMRVVVELSCCCELLLSCCCWVDSFSSNRCWPWLSLNCIEMS